MGVENNRFRLRIGDVAEATGFSVFRLRQWERRYNSPVSKKLDSGHRRYDVHEVVRLKLVRRVLELGYRANQVVPMKKEELEVILWDKTDGIKGSERWMDAILEFDREKLVAEFERDWQEQGLVNFVAEKMAQFIVGIGQAWVDKKIEITHEHFFSQCVENFLASKWNNTETDGSRWIMAALDEEYHALGMQMVSTILTYHKKGVIYVGKSTPTEQLIAMCREESATALCLSISSNYPADQAREKVIQIRREIPESCLLIAGGAGAPDGIEGVERFNDLRVFSDWVALSS